MHHNVHIIEILGVRVRVRKIEVRQRVISIMCTYDALRTLPPLDCKKTPLGKKSCTTHGLF